MSSYTLNPMSIRQSIEWFDTHLFVGGRHVASISRLKAHHWLVLGANNELIYVGDGNTTKPVFRRSKEMAMLAAMAYHRQDWWTFLGVPTTHAN